MNQDKPENGHESELEDVETNSNLAKGLLLRMREDGKSKSIKEGMRGRITKACGRN